MLKKIFYYLLFMATSYHFAGAQSIVGTWKRIANVIENEDGSQKEMQKTMEKSMPCAADIKYIFEAGGKEYTQSSGACALIDKMSKANWTINGNVISMVSTGGALAKKGDASYVLAFSGTTVTFTHEYTAEEKAKLGMKVKRIIITYQRI